MGNTEIKRRCAIICGGEVASPKLLADNITSEDYIICADSGYNHALAAGLTPDLFVGDFDSFAGEIPPDLVVTPLPVHKDVTDTHAAVLEGLSQGYSDFVLFGALGGRIDHSFANFSLLKLILDKGGTARIIYDHGFVTALSGGSLILPRTDSFLSIFPFGGNAAGVTLEGFEYPLKDALLTPDNPVGISNHIIDEQGKITLKEGFLIIMQVEE